LAGVAFLGWKKCVKGSKAAGEPVLRGVIHWDVMDALSSFSLTSLTRLQPD